MALTKVNYKAVLMDAGDSLPKQLFASNQYDCETWAKSTLDGLTKEQKVSAYVRVVELKEVPLCDVHPAKLLGEFAIARYDHKEPTTV